MVSLKDIASECGVSIATVSKALNDHSDIGADTKTRIRKAAKDMGYVPNAAAKSMKTNRTHNIGVLFMDDANSGLTHDFFAGVLESFKREVEREGYDITFISNDRSRPGRASYLEHARYRRFDGVIIANVHFDDPEVVELVKSNIPVVTIDHIYNETTTILSDNVGGMSDLVDFAVQNGHTRIAYIHGVESATTNLRLVTFNRKLEEYGIEVPEEYIAAALSPSEVISVTMQEDGKSCRVIVPDNQLSLAIGKEGQNARLAAKLTGYKIDIKPASEA